MERTPQEIRVGISTYLACTFALSSIFYTLIIRAGHLSAGHGLYVQPSLHYVPWPYPPMYFWTSAAVAHVTGVGFLALRLVSFTASLATSSIRKPG